MNTNATKTASVNQGALKLKDACRYLGGISPSSVRRLIDRKLLKANRALRHILIPISELDRFLAGGNNEASESRLAKMRAHSFVCILGKGSPAHPVEELHGEFARIDGARVPHNNSAPPTEQPVCAASPEPTKRQARRNKTMKTKSIGQQPTELQTKKQAARLLSVSTRYIERQTRLGRLRACRLGHKVTRFPRKDIDAFLDSGATTEGGL
jgi:excisionase family DNA binding protein